MKGNFPHKMIDIFLKITKIIVMSYVRKASHGGEWYPTDPKKLTTYMEASFYYTNAKPHKKVGVRGIISPHSCYDVCLRTAAHSYARIDPDLYDKIIVFGTCHHMSLSTILVSEASSVETPFGPINVDTETCKQFVEEKPEYFAFMSQEADEAEHSLEMQYPIIKYVFGDRDIQIIPFLVGSLNEQREDFISEYLKPYFNQERTLFIISTDFTHWGEYFHFTEYAIMKKRELGIQLELFDDKAINIISAFNYEHFRFHIEEISGSICGCYSICLALHILGTENIFEKVYRSELCKLKTFQDFSISYIAGVFYDAQTAIEEEEEEQQEQQEEENEEEQEH